MLGSAALVLDREAIARAEAAKLSQFIAPYREEFPDVSVRLRSRRGSAGRELLHRAHRPLVICPSTATPER